eukprot:Lankesteria_metandrocarpae@DN1786_c0_g1_i1.p1
MCNMLILTILSLLCSGVFGVDAKLGCEANVERGRSSGVKEVIQDCRLYIINGSADDIVLVSNSSVATVTGWVFSDIPAGDPTKEITSRAFDISFKSSDEYVYNIAQANFKLGDSEESSFTIKVVQCAGDTRTLQEEGPCMVVAWSVDESKYAVSPENRMYFRPNASIDLIILKKLATSPKAPPTNAKWMERSAGVISDLSILEMSWPCSHDSGSYEPKLPFVDLYAATQFLSIFDQLANGVRVLDFRIASDNGVWVITHGTYVMSYTVLSAVREVQLFVDYYPQEFVILDFHNLNELRRDEEPDPAELREYIREVLGDYHLDHDGDSGLTLASPLSALWSAAGSSKRRILLSWNTDPSQFGEGEPWMWPRINQKWFSTVDTVNDLYGNLTVWWGTSPEGTPASELYPLQSGTLPAFPGNTFHSTCVFTNGLLPLAAQSKILERNVVEWFHGTDLWSLNANILSLNFIPHGTDIVQACIVANLVKGHNKSLGVLLNQAPVEV